MLNVTSRLAVKITNLPDFPFSWSDSTPQHSRQSVTVEDFLPSEVESSALEHRAVQFMMEFLVEAFSSLHDLKRFVLANTPLHPPQTSHVVPMKLLFRDEKYKSETIEILSQLIHDANLSGDPQVRLNCYLNRAKNVNLYFYWLVVGDQLTCKNIRGCKLWRQPEIDPKERLGWANEIPGEH